MHEDPSQAPVVPLAPYLHSFCRSCVSETENSLERGLLHSRSLTNMACQTRDGRCQSWQGIGHGGSCTAHTSHARPHYWLAKTT